MKNIMRLFVTLGLIAMSVGIAYADETNLCIAGETNESANFIEGIILAANGYGDPCEIDRDCGGSLICTAVGSHRECRYSP